MFLLSLGSILVVASHVGAQQQCDEPGRSRFFKYPPCINLGINFKYNFAGKCLVMVIGGYSDQDNIGSNIELVSLDDTAVPECLSELNPFPFGSIYKAVGAALAPGKYECLYTDTPG